MKGRGGAALRRALLVAALSTLALGLAIARSVAAPEEGGSTDESPPPHDRSTPPAAASSSPGTAATRVANPAPAGNAQEIRPPADLTDLSLWLKYQRSSQRSSLPNESRLFYRRGLVAWKSGARDEAVRLVRGAAELDPMFAEPHFTVASWSLFRDPGQALLEWAALLELARQSFLFQLSFVANGLVFLVQSLFLGLLACGLILVGLRNHELRHGWQEQLSQFLTPRAARKWPWVFLAVPYLVGVGVALPTVLFLGMLWPTLKLRERTLLIGLTASLLAVPLVSSQIGRMAVPMDENRAPFYGVLNLPGEPYTAARRQRLAELARRHPNDPVLQFGLAWLTRQGSDLAGAEAAYLRTLELWPVNDRVLNNLANVTAIQGRPDDAIKLYKRSITANPSNATAYYNLAQLYTKRFDFQKATDALSHAAALNFDLLRTHELPSASGGHMPLVDQWILPRDLWRVLQRESFPAPGAAAVPPAWRNHIECSGPWFPLPVLMFLALGLALGITQQRSMPLRRCSNCDRVVCRRCAERRRELALCRSCAAVELRAKAPDFARVLLLEHRRKVQRPGRIARTVLASMIPGFGLLAFRKLFTPLVLLTFTGALVCVWADAATPFAFQPGLALPERESSMLVDFLPWVGIYAASVLGYMAELARHDARVASRTKSTRSRGPTARPAPAAAA